MAPPSSLALAVFLSTAYLERRKNDRTNETRGTNERTNERISRASARVRARYKRTRGDAITGIKGDTRGHYAIPKKPARRPARKFADASCFPAERISSRIVPQGGWRIPCPPTLRRPHRSHPSLRALERSPWRGMVLMIFGGCQEWHPFLAERAKAGAGHF